MINYFSYLIIPITIFIILLHGLIEKKKVFEIFLDGAKEGMEITIKIFPTLLGLFVAVGVLRYSGILDFFVKLICPFIDFLGIPKEIMPLAILRPISRKCFNCCWNRYNEYIWSG